MKLVTKDKDNFSALSKDINQKRKRKRYSSVYLYSAYQKTLFIKKLKISLIFIWVRFLPKKKKNDTKSKKAKSI